MRVCISRAALDAILRRAAASPHTEVCGLLLGDTQGTIGEARDAPNRADDPATRFEVDPAVLFDAHRAARQGGPAILGHYHSHPGGNVRPSPCDAELAVEDGILWLICAPDGGYALWKTGDGGLHGRFSRCAIDIVEPPMALASRPA